MGDHAPSDPTTAADEAQHPDKRSTYRISKTATDQIPLAIVETACRAENLTLTTWSSSVVLSNTLHKLGIVLPPPPPPASGHGFGILELGAGTGLSGLSGACVWRSRALLTELPEIVPGLQANIDANAAVLAAEGAAAACGTLDWNSPTEIHLYDPSSAPAAHTTIHVADEANKFPIVMAADTMYTEDHPELLTRTMAACLSRTPEARVIVCWPMRVCYLDHSREFWRLMDERGLVTVQEGQEYADFDGLDDEPLHEWCVFRWKDLA